MSKARAVRLALLAMTIALCAPASTHAAPSGVFPPAWFEQAITTGTLSPGSNCDWVNQKKEAYPPGSYGPGSPAVGDYIWVLPATLGGSVFSPPSTFQAAFDGRPGTSCQRDLPGGRKLNCAAWQQGRYPQSDTYDLSAACTVDDGLCLREGYRSLTNGITYVDTDRGTLDCPPAPTRRKCKKGPKGKASAGKKPRCAPKKARQG